MTDNIKRVRLKDAVSGEYLYPETGLFIPTKTSDLTNDSDFATISDLPVVPDDVSEFNNDAGYLTSVSWEDISEIPEVFTPDEHTHTTSDITNFPYIPTNTSDLNNDSNFLSAVPVATDEVLGGIKIGSGLHIDNSGVVTAQELTVDSTIDGTSENPVQNQAVSDALDEKQDLITTTDKLDADLVDDSTSTNKFVTSSQISAISSATQDISTIQGVLEGMGDIVTHDADEFASSSHTHSGYLTQVTWSDVLYRPDVNDAVISIQKNGTAVDSFSVNQSSNKTINLSIPVTAADVGALPDNTVYGSSISLDIDPSTYVVTLALLDDSGSTISSDTIDLPLESVVVSGSYDSSNKKVVLTLQSGSNVEFSVADLISGLQSEITSNNKLDADLVDDSTSTNKFVTASDKTTWNGKQNAITSSAKLDADLVDDSNSTNKFATSEQLSAISTNTSGISTINNTIANYGDVVTHDASEFATSTHTHSEYLTQHQDISGKQDASTAVTHTASTAVGSATKPVYINSSGVATECTYTLGKSVPADAVFTDTVTTSLAWSDITDIPSTFTPESHSHLGSEVTLTGYSKASSASAVAATDTVNAAIGKLEKALDGKQASGTYLTSSTGVTLSGIQEITGEKTFKGEKKVKFKQSSANNKLGFTCYDYTGKECAYLEYNPTANIDSKPMLALGNYAANSNPICQVGFRRYSDVSGADGAYNLLTPLIADAKTPFSLTNTYTNFYMPLGFSDGTTTIKAAKSGVVDLSSLSLGSATTIATSVNSSSTNDEAVGAKLFYDTCGDIATLINNL